MALRHLLGQTGNTMETWENVALCVTSYTTTAALYQRRRLRHRIAAYLTSTLHSSSQLLVNNFIMVIPRPVPQVTNKYYISGIWVDNSMRVSLQRVALLFGESLASCFLDVYDKMLILVIHFLLIEGICFHFHTLTDGRVHKRVQHDQSKIPAFSCWLAHYQLNFQFFFLSSFLSLCQISFVVTWSTSWRRSNKQFLFLLCMKLGIDIAIPLTKYAHIESWLQLS